MPLYSFYPQGRGAAGEKIDARLPGPDEAHARAGEILAAHAGATEISIWCEDEYIGRVGAEPWTPGAKAPGELTAALDDVLASTAKPKKAAAAKASRSPKRPRSAPRPPAS